MGQYFDLDNPEQQEFWYQDETVGTRATRGTRNGQPSYVFLTQIEKAHYQPEMDRDEAVMLVLDTMSNPTKGKADHGAIRLAGWQPIVYPKTAARLLKATWSLLRIATPCAVSRRLTEVAGRPAAWRHSHCCDYLRVALPRRLDMMQHGPELNRQVTPCVYHALCHLLFVLMGAMKRWAPSSYALVIKGQGMHGTCS